MPLKKEIFDRITQERETFMNEQRANEELNYQDEQRYQDFQEKKN